MNKNLKLKIKNFVIPRPDSEGKRVVIIILFIAAFLRFYNLMHDAPFFFNPDERNMASAITRFSLPSRLSEIPRCVIEEFFIRQQSRPTDDQPLAETTNCTLNPHFFAYGQFPLYLAYASDQLTKPFTNILSKDQRLTTNDLLTTSFPSAIFWLRFWSALSSTFTVLLVYLITKQLTEKFQAPNHKHQITNLFEIWSASWRMEFGHFAALMVAFTPGLIQSAHFGTTESLLTFFFMFSIYVSVSYLSKLSHLRFILLTSLAIGLSLGSKLTGLFFFVPPGVSLIIRIIELFPKFVRSTMNNRSHKTHTTYMKLSWVGLLIVIGSVVIAILSSPYNVVEPQNFLSAVFGYEADVASGKFPAFYTRQFIGTVPLVFQMQKIFPYQLGGPIFILGIIGFLLINFKLLHNVLHVLVRKYQISKIKDQIYISNIKYKKIFDFLYVFLIFDLSFLIYFVPNAFLFAKWTRFMTPLLPFFAIFAGYFLYQISNIKYQIDKSKIKNKKIFNILYVFLIFAILFFIFLPGLAFFSIYTHDDSRVTASRWIYDNIPDGSYILSETANVVDIPIHIPSNDQRQKTNDYTVVSFDFYHLNVNPSLREDLYQHLARANYILVPSRRIFANHLPHPDQFPQASRYYQLLFSGQLGFEEVAKITSFPTLTLGPWQWQFDDEGSEESSTVFDHPVIRIYQKIHPHTEDAYRYLFTIPQ